MKFKSPTSFVWILTGIWALGMTLLVWQSIALCNGHLIYAIDDPYIHLSVAENILQGGYGVNLGEYSAPSSSIIYPFILAGTEWIKLGSAGPLVINLLAMGGAVFMLGKILEKHVFPSISYITKSSLDYTYFLVVGVLLCLVMNAWGLVLIGMEHSLQIFLCLIIFHSFLEVVVNNKAPPVSLYLALIILPLIRFEGLALSILGIIFLIYLGHKRVAVISAFVVALLLVLWATFMDSKNLPFFPSSVQLKSEIVADLKHGTISSLIDLILKNFSNSLPKPHVITFCLILLILSWLVYREFKNSRRMLAYLSLGILLAGVAHAALGRFGWGVRYESYATILIWLMIIYLLRDFIKNKYIKIALIFVLIDAARYHSTWTVTRMSALATRNIYEQQYQMHRFVVDFWKRPVAVNDLGWVSYKNDFYVLDLWGLGSEDVRLSKMSGTYNSSKINELIAKNNISFIMIYDEWFNGVIPGNWEKVATLETSCISATYGLVQFYIPNKKNINEAKKLLADFSLDLPAGAKIIIEP